MKSNLTPFSVRLERALLLSGRSLANIKWRLDRRIVVGQMDGTWIERDAEELLKRLEELLAGQEG